MLAMLADERVQNVYTWGRNEMGQLGHGGTRIESRARKLQSMTDRILHVSCGRDFTFFVSDAGKVFSCGNNSSGQLGLGRTVVNEEGSRFAPLRPVLLVSAVTVSTAAVSLPTLATVMSLRLSALWTTLLTMTPICPTARLTRG